MTELRSPIHRHYNPRGAGDVFASRLVRFLRVFADLFFARRYGHRAVVLETVAAVPGMVGGLLQHLKALRHIRDDQGWIRELLDEAENERMHLMTFVEIAKPTLLERVLIMAAQAIFYNLYFFLYLLFPKTAHRGCRLSGRRGSDQLHQLSRRDRRGASSECSRPPDCH